MTPEEQNAIDAWFAVCQQAQPPGTLAILLYDRDGDVHIGRSDTPFEYRDFKLDNLPTVVDLVAENAEAVYRGRLG